MNSNHSTETDGYNQCSNQTISTNGMVRKNLSFSVAVSTEKLYFPVYSAPILAPVTTVYLAAPATHSLSSAVPLTDVPSVDTSLTTPIMISQCTLVH
jgi:hypothetical protein